MTEEEKKKASKGVRKNIDGKVLGEYNMRQDNTRMRNIGPTETPDLTDKQKEDLATVTDARGEGWKKTKEGVFDTEKLKGHWGSMRGPRVDNIRTADNGVVHPTTNIYDEYKNEKGQKRSVKTGERNVQMPYKNFLEDEEPEIGTGAFKVYKDRDLKTGKANEQASNYYNPLGKKPLLDTDPNDPELVKHKPTNNK